MKKYIILSAVFLIAVSANAEITCIGKIGKTLRLDTRVTIWEDGLNKIEIRPAGDFAYIGEIKTDYMGLPTGIATSSEGRKIEFDYEMLHNSKTGATQLDFAYETEQGAILGGMLNCVVLD